MDLPNDSAPKRFIQLLSEKIDALSQLKYPSERVLVLISTMLQREKIVKQAKDIRNLLQLWEANE